MSPEERQEFWESIDSGDNPLLSVMSGLVEKWACRRSSCVSVTSAMCWQKMPSMPTTSPPTSGD